MEPDQHAEWRSTLLNVVAYGIDHGFIGEERSMIMEATAENSFVKISIEHGPNNIIPFPTQPK
jgi:hypothetical protein